MADMNWMQGLQAGSMAMSLFGARQASNAYNENAEAIRTAKYYEAAQLEQAAGQAMAAAQRRAQEERRQATLVASRALAIAAASGGGASDPTVIRTMARIAGEGEYRGAVSIYDAEERARVMRMKAAGSRYEGEAAIRSGESAASATMTRGLASILPGVGSLFSKYASGGASAAGDAGLLRDTSSYATSANPWGASI